MEKCKTCGGTGDGKKNVVSGKIVEDFLCPDCHGTGEVEKADNGLTLSAKIKDILNDFEHADDIVRNIFLIPDFQKECKACKVQYKTSLLDRVEAELPTFRFYCRYYSDLTDDMVGCIANENGHCNNDECKALSEVKKAISKIRGLEK